MKNAHHTEIPELDTLAQTAPPNAVEAEQGALSIILSGGADGLAIRFATAKQIISRESFYHPALRLIWDAVEAHVKESQPVDIGTLSATLRHRNQLEKVGGSGFLSELFVSCYTDAHFDFYLREMRAKHLLRKGREITCQFLADSVAHGTEPGADVTKILGAFEAQIFSLVQSSQEGGDNPATRVMSQVELIHDWDDSLTKAMEDRKNGINPGISLGSPDLDRAIGALNHDEDGELVLLCATPRSGKSMACVSWLEAIAVEQNIPCMVFPLEMGRKKFMTRLLLGRAKIDTQKHMTHEFERREFERIHEAERELSKSTILWDHSAFIDIATLRARVQVAHREHGVKVVFIDHLGQLKPSTKEGISDFLTGEREIMEGLHSLRRELGIVIILAVQLNKAATANKPKGNLSALTDVKGASEKYEYATHVVFIKRPCLDTPWNKLSRERQDEWELTTRRYRLGNPTCWTQGIDVPDYMTVGEKDYEEHAYFSFIKNRNGPPADQVCVRFRGEYQRFAPRTMKVYESDLDKRPVSLPTFY